MAIRKIGRLCIVLALLLAGFGQTTYACADMEMPPQPICCCDNAVEPDCDVTCAGDGAPCCTTAFEALDEQGPTAHSGFFFKPAKAFPDQPPDDTPWYLAYTIPQRFSLTLDRAHADVGINSFPSYGTRTYLHTLRLRI